jgi:hypothetical protein
MSLGGDRDTYRYNPLANASLHSGSMKSSFGKASSKYKQVNAKTSFNKNSSDFKKEKDNSSGHQLASIAEDTEVIRESDLLARMESVDEDSFVNTDGIN